ncbi:unnamed protein product [marine sediment metagenome]|uniref:Uncharacterized protein n=1 Tax=marine sediment metagenome TaxID=412755 RepID=X1LG58_9ZZZZ
MTNNLQNFSFWTSVIGNFKAAHFLIDSFPYELNVVVDEIGQKIIPDKPNIIKYEAYPSNENIYHSLHPLEINGSPPYRCIK